MFFFEKRTKKLLLSGAAFGRVACLAVRLVAFSLCTEIIKVFCFFSSEKKPLLTECPFNDADQLIGRFVPAETSRSRTACVLQG